jgi:hypothetical protein
MGEVDHANIFKRAWHRTSLLPVYWAIPGKQNGLLGVSGPLWSR